MIIYKATRFSRSKKSTAVAEIRRARKRTEMIKTIICITFSYTIIELPCFVFNGYFYLTVIVLDIGELINVMFNNIQFSYPAFNIFILFASNKLFAKELKKFLGLVKNRKTSVKTRNSLITSPGIKSQNDT